MPYKEGNNPTRIETTIADQDGAVIDVSAQTTLETRVKPPGGAVEVVGAAFDGVKGNGLGTDGKVFSSYTTPLRPGTTTWEVHVVLASGEYYTETGSFFAAAQV